MLPLGCTWLVRLFAPTRTDATMEPHFFANLFFLFFVFFLLLLFFWRCNVTSFLISESEGICGIERRNQVSWSQKHESTHQSAVSACYHCQSTRVIFHLQTTLKLSQKTDCILRPARSSKSREHLKRRIHLCEPLHVLVMIWTQDPAGCWIYLVQGTLVDCQNDRYSVVRPVVLVAVEFLKEQNQNQALCWGNERIVEKKHEQFVLFWTIYTHPGGGVSFREEIPKPLKLWVQCQWILSEHQMFVVVVVFSFFYFSFDQRIEKNTRASVSRSALWSVENLMLSVFFGPFFIVMMNSVFCGPLTFGTMLMNSSYGHCNDRAELQFVVGAKSKISKILMMAVLSFSFEGKLAHLVGNFHVVWIVCRDAMGADRKDSLVPVNCETFCKLRHVAQQSQLRIWSFFFFSQSVHQLLFQI